MLSDCLCVCSPWHTSACAITHTLSLPPTHWLLHLALLGIAMWEAEPTNTCMGRPRNCPCKV
jgi:hypothetical protein